MKDAFKKPKIFFNPIDGSGILSIAWFPGPLGDAIEDQNGLGIGFFAHNGELLSVQFDDVEEKQDHQILAFNRYRVEVKVMKGQITYSKRELSSKGNIRPGQKKAS